MRSAPSRHDEILREAIDDRGEYVYKTVGDAFCAARLSDMDLPLQEPYRSFVRSRLDRAASEAAIGEGRNMTPRQDIDYALEDERGAGSRTREAPA
jgi:hypothetical protein